MLFLLILIIIACLLLTLVVLIQNPKGGGIAANFTAPNQIMGANRSTDVIEKSTWVLAIALIVLSLASNFLRPNGEVEATGTESRIKDNIEATTPVAPQQPAAQPQQQAQPAATPADSAAH